MYTCACARAYGKSVVDRVGRHDDDDNHHNADDNDDDADDGYTTEQSTEEANLVGKEQDRELLARNLLVVQHVLQLILHDAHAHFVRRVDHPHDGCCFYVESCVVCFGGELGSDPKVTH